MDFRHSTQSNNVRSADVSHPASNHAPKVGNKSVFKGPQWLQVLYGVVFVGIVVLLVGIVLGVSRGNDRGEFKYVDSSKYQAVFLNDNQVYFGHISSLNDKYIRLGDVYYVVPSTSSSGSSNSGNTYNLLQLGCQQIHYPTDQMLINREQVKFWENLNDKGQVVTKINELKKQGVDCSQATAQTQATSTTTQGSNATPQNSPSTSGK